MSLYPNGTYYENLEEATRRLLNTVVMYDGEPYTILSISERKPDGIFRIYLGSIKGSPMGKNWPNEYMNYHHGSAEQVAYLDKWIEEHKDGVILRKKANSPLFNKFRPFPLGMMNVNGRVQYLQRSPQRQIQQGLTRNAVTVKDVSLDSRVNPYAPNGGYGGHLSGPEFYSCVKADHPSAKECFERLRDPNVENNAVAFHREFAFIRGPLDTLYLAYKADVIGLVTPEGNEPSVKIGRKFKHCKEVVQETGAFASVTVQG
jgi:hypothetical protein